MKLTPVLFIDLDGTLRRPTKGEFVEAFDDQELIPGAKEMLEAYRRRGFKICVVTNQGGVAHGFKTPVSFQKEFLYFVNLLKPVKVDYMKACFHHPDGTVQPYCTRSIFRKPATGMIAMLEVELYNDGFVVDYPNSLMVGDRPEDEGLAKNAGVHFLSAEEWLKPHPITLKIRKWCT